MQIESFDYSPSEFHTMTTGLTPQERMVLRTLLDLLWLAQETDCALADDDNLPSALETTPAKWRSIRKRVLGSHVLAAEGDGWIYSPWLRDKLLRARSIRRSLQERGRSGGLATAAKNPATAKQQLSSGHPTAKPPLELPPDAPENPPHTPPMGKNLEPPGEKAGGVYPPLPPHDGSLTAYPLTAEALSRFPSEPTQGQMPDLMALVSKRGDVLAAALVDHAAAMARGDPKRSSLAILFHELRTRKEAPKNARKPNPFAGLKPDIGDGADPPN